MNYQRIYDSLIERARHRILKCYVERHHVIPKCMGGTDGANQVELTPEEHYVAHQLLVKIYPENDKLLFAAHMMCCGRTTNKLYGWLRRRHAEAVGLQNAKHTGKKSSQFGTRWITNGKKNQKIKRSDSIPNGWRIGRFLVKATVRIRSCKNCGKPFNVVGANSRLYCTDSCRHEKISQILSICMKGKNTRPKTAEHRAKIGLAQLGRIRGPYSPRK